MMTALMNVEKIIFPIDKKKFFDKMPRVVFNKKIVKTIAAAY